MENKIEFKEVGKGYGDRYHAYVNGKRSKYSIGFIKFFGQDTFNFQKCLRMRWEGRMIVTSESNANDNSTSEEEIKEKIIKLIGNKPEKEWILR